MSPDIAAKLETYLALLRKWQKSINLVSNSTLDEARERHFEDSLQLKDYIPEGATVFDLGSGAGFPGLVLAIARPDIKMTLIESDTKKCTFLSTVSRETQTPVTIWNQRIESVPQETIPTIVTARALASLDKLLEYCLPWASQNPDLVMLFLKGEKAKEELEKSHQAYDFTEELFSGKTGGGGWILRVTDLRVKSGA